MLTPTIVARGQPRNRLVTEASMAQTNELSPPIDELLEFETVTFDFGPVLAEGVTLSSPTLTCKLAATSPANVKDDTPANRLVGPAQVGTSPSTGRANQAVLQLFGGCVANAKYLIQCIAATSDGQELSLWTHLVCRSPS